MEPRLGCADRNLQNRGSFFEREVVLITKQKDGSACGRDLVEETQEGLVRWLAEKRIEGSQLFSWGVI